MREGPAKGELDAEGVLKWRPQTDCGPGYAVDGDTDTAWAWDSKNEGTGWLEIDFGKVESFNFVELANVHRCSKVDIAVKREEKWETIHTFDRDQWKTLTYSTHVPLTKARYVRMVVKMINGLGFVSEVRLLHLR